jgi:hypothetical protein
MVRHGGVPRDWSPACLIHHLACTSRTKPFWSPQGYSYDGKAIPSPYIPSNRDLGMPIQTKGVNVLTTNLVFPLGEVVVTQTAGSKRCGLS